ADAMTDLDDDGFSNVEEFNAGSDPQNPTMHPPYATKLRFVKRQEVPFPLVFQGVTRLSDGSTVFQLNSPADGFTHFLSMGEELEGVVLQHYNAEPDGGPPRLFVKRGSSEIELIRGKVAADPESKAELINILDRSSIIATMGTLLSLHDDEYVVLGVYHDKVVIRHLETGDVFDIIGLAERER
ncbi:MAG: Amuc_1099 family pilus-like system protein, partial [Pontiella sp.]